jgi:hypothetical protein
MLRTVAPATLENVPLDPRRTYPGAVNDYVVKAGTLTAS